MPQWTCLELLITSICNRKCQECCYRIPAHTTLEPKHYSWDIFERAAEAFNGISKLYVSGGEATLHPDFEKISKEFKSLFNTKNMILVSNGYNILKYQKSLEYFDYIWITDFKDEYSANSIRWVEDNYKDKLMLAQAKHIPLNKKGGGKKCSRYGLMASANDKAFPCCIGPGLISAPFATVEPLCVEKIKLLEAPCSTCAFSV